LRRTVRSLFSIAQGIKEPGLLYSGWVVGWFGLNQYERQHHQHKGGEEHVAKACREFGGVVGGA
jgi:hypothetical protein